MNNKTRNYFYAVVRNIGIVPVICADFEDGLYYMINKFGMDMYGLYSTELEAQQSRLDNIYTGVYNVDWLNDEEVQNEKE